jgi:hypothetical protein
MIYVFLKMLALLLQVSSFLILLAENNFDVKTGAQNGVTGLLRT